MPGGGLPRYFVLQPADGRARHSNYLRYVHEGANHGALQFCTRQQAISPFSKHEFEPAKEESNKGLYHIRCGYSNKYWTTKPSGRIFATADEPDEDRSKLSCTLFDPTMVRGDPSKLRLLHVASNKYLVGRTCDLFASTAPEKLYDPDNNYSITDWESFVILPERVVFKGDNDRYLRLCYLDNNRPYLTFDSTDVGLATLPNRVFYTSEGNVRIQSEANGKFWNLHPNWIWAESSEETLSGPYDNSDSVFWLVKGRGDNEVAIRNLANNKFCRRLTTEGKTDCLNASASTMSKEAIFKVEEPVISRKIDNIDFRLNEARFYDEKVVSLFKKTFANPTPQDHITTITKTYTTDITTTWKASISLKLGVKFTVKHSVMIIAKGKLEVSADLQAGFEYGVATKKVVTDSISDNIKIPPNSIMTVSVIATEAKYDVPYSYTQVDTLTNGEQVSYEKHDGTYSGCNSYNFKTELDYKKIKIDECF